MPHQALTPDPNMSAGRPDLDQLSVALQRVAELEAELAASRGRCHELERYADELRESLTRLHDEEHRLLWHRSPDACGCALEPPLRGRTPLSAATEIVIGRGDRRSRIRASGGDDERSRQFRERAERLIDGPIVVELGGGVCLRGPSRWLPPWPGRW